jgi:putative transposase
VSADVCSLAEATDASVSAVCRALGIARSTVYAGRKRAPGARARDTARLDVEIAAIHKKSRGRYGSPRVHRELRRQGRRVGRKRVEARMRQQGLFGKRPRRFRRTTVRDPRQQPAPNVLARRFGWELPNQAWVGDITYLLTHAGWVYLAILVDLCTRAIIGWTTSTRCDGELALACLNKAVGLQKPSPGLLVHHDQGSTYTAGDYRKRLDELSALSSMSRKGNCWDNAVAESTFATIKVELFGDEIPADLAQVDRALFEYIEIFYNRQRLHSTLGYITPAEKEALAYPSSIAG